MNPRIAPIAFAFAVATLVMMETKGAQAQQTYTLTDIASFTGTGTGNNGDGPTGIVAIDGAGDMFGTTGSGGLYDQGTVWEIAAGTGTVTDISSFTGIGAGGNGANPRAGVTIDSAGNLYGTTQTGGADNFGVVWEIAAGSSAITDIATFTGADAGTNGGFPVADVTIDGAGNLYGTTMAGGEYGAGAVWEIAKGSSTLIDIAGFNYNEEVLGVTGGSPRGGVTVDSAGDLFGTTDLSLVNTTFPTDTMLDSGSVWEIASGTNTITYLANFTGPQFGSSVIPGIPGGGVTIDSVGNLYGTTQEGGSNELGTVWEIPKGGSLIYLASFTAATGSDPEGDLTIDKAGDIFGTAAGGGTGDDGTVWELANGSDTLVTIANFTGDGSGTNGGMPLAALTVDSSGDFYSTTDEGGADSYGTVFELHALAAPEPGALALLATGLASLAPVALLRRGVSRTRPTQQK